MERPEDRLTQRRAGAPAREPEDLQAHRQGSRPRSDGQPPAGRPAPGSAARWPAAIPGTSKTRRDRGRPVSTPERIMALRVKAGVTRPPSTAIKRGDPQQPRAHAFGGPAEVERDIARPVDREQRQEHHVLRLWPADQADRDLGGQHRQKGKVDDGDDHRVQYSAEGEGQDVRPARPRPRRSPTTAAARRCRSIRARRSGRTRRSRHAA